MTAIRLRHPKGVTTIHVDLDNDATKVSDLQQVILSATEIPPSLQDLKSGYPPQALTLIPQLPLSSLGLNKHDQLIVTQTAASSITHAPRPAPRTTAPSTTTSTSTTFPRRGPPITQPGSQALGDDHVPTDGGALIHRVVPDDNSCLFSSLGVVFEQDMRAAPRLRQLAADAIRDDPKTYTEALLGRPRDQYMKTILSPNSWGGAIELSIFAQHYRAEIASIDIETGRIDRFGEDASYASRVILLYSGIHYDATSLAPTPSAPLDFHETLFPVANAAVMSAAQVLAAKLREQKKFTNTATFLLKCEICSVGLKGEKEARQHANETGHAQFGEYS